jgi:multiple sugar transport system substrate-binding protein
MCEQLGSPYTSATGDNFLFNNDTNKSFCKQFRTWYKEALMTTQELLGTYTSVLFTSTTDPKSYMSIGSSAGATHQRPRPIDGAYPFEVGIAPIPQMDANNPKVISQGPSLCMFKKDDPQEMAATWLFMKFLTTNVELQANFSMESGYVPAISSVSSSPAYANWLASANGTSNIAALSAKQCLAQKDYYFTSPAFVGSSIARQQVGLLLTKILAASGDVNSIVDNAFNLAIEDCRFYQ